MEKNFTMTVNKTDFPMLFNLKGNKFNNICDKIFRTGYLSHFPDVTNLLKEDNFSRQFQLLRSEIRSPELLEKFDMFEATMNKLIGISSNSTLKGDFAENMLEKMFNKRYGDIKYEDKSQTPHSGDAWLHFWDDFIAMLESKNYTTNISLDEVKKMERDMKEHNINWGIFISWNSGIVGMKEFDIHTFNHEGNSYTIILISNLGKDESRLDFAVQLLRTLKTCYSNPDKFPWIVSEIKDELIEFEEICKLNYILRDNYNVLDSNIKKSLNEYYIKLRDYQMKLEKKSNDIICKITNTMEKSIIKSNFNQTEILETFKNKKVTNVLSKFLDVLVLLKWDVNVKDTIELTKDNDKIGICKVMNKKISINISKLNITIEIKENDIDINDKLESIKILNSLIYTNKIL